MAGHDLDHRFSDTGPQMVIVYAPGRRPVARIPVPHAERSGWMLRGACRSEDPELFFPISAAGPGLAQVSSAKAVCGRCPVRANCLSYALITRPDGIWGGTTREERWASLPRAKRPEDRLSGDLATDLRGWQRE